MSSEDPPWSGWEWSTHWNCYERRRWNYGEGKWDFSYDQSTPAPSNVPRSNDASDLVAGFSNQMNLNPPVGSYYQHMGHAPTPSIPTLAYNQQGYNQYPPTGIHISPTPRRVPAKPTNIKTKRPDDKAEAQDPRYKTRRSRDFEFGRIFKVLWSEPIGSGGTVITAVAAGHSKVRRFVIIDTRKGHSICLPILTYGGQGVLKNGAHPEDHAVIFSSKKPFYLDGERALIKKRSIKCEMDTDEHKLDDTSRLNYAKLYTVEHNVKVFFVGRVAKNSEQKVVVDYRDTHPGLEDRPYMPEDSDTDATSYAEGADPSYTTDANQQSDAQSWRSAASTGSPSTFGGSSMFSQDNRFESGDFDADDPSAFGDSGLFSQDEPFESKDFAHDTHP